MNIVTRFAPSPTGHLHIGGARTAIFCWLLARHHGGAFLLRIEDTDTERSKQEYTDSILASIHWLGLVPKGEALYQHQRFAIYNEYIDKLLSTGHAYWCDCTAEQVEAMREKARAEGKKPKYNGCCRTRGLEAGPGRVVRFLVPAEGQVAFKDIVKGPIAFDVQELDDMILRRTDGAPTYNLAVVVDDMTMHVTHVMRGDDHVNNTPRQTLIYEALGAPLPLFGHVPMILGPDKQKLSKRHGAKAVIDYEADGLLPEALINYLVRLGWSHGDQEIFSIDELVTLFDGTSMSSSPAAFDLEKLAWVNAQHLRAKSPAELLPSLLPFLHRALLPVSDIKRILALIPLFQPRSSTLVELADQIRPLLVDAAALEHDPKALAKVATGKPHLTALRQQFAVLFESQTTPSVTAIHDVLTAYVTDNSLKFKEVGPVLRVALMGFAGGPDLAEAMHVLGNDETLARIDQMLALL